MFRFQGLPLCWYFLFVTLLTQAQTSSMDSLRTAYRLADAQGQIRLGNQLATALREINPAEALTLSKQVRQLSAERHDTAALGKALENLGWLYYRNGDWATSFGYSSQAYDIFEKTQNKRLGVNVLNSLVGIFSTQARYDTCVQLCKRALQMSRSIPDDRLTGRTLNNLTYILTLMGKTDTASRVGWQALHLNENTRDAYLTGIALRNLGDIALTQDSLPMALALFGRCMSLADSMSNQYLRVSACYRIGGIYTKLNQPRKGLSYLIEAVNIARTHHYPDELAAAYLNLGKAYARLENYKEAYTNMENYQTVDDSIYSNYAERRAALILSISASEKQRHEIEILAKSTRTQAGNIRQQQMVIYVIFVALLLSAGLAFFLLRLNRRQKESNFELAVQKEEITAQIELLENKNMEIEDQAQFLREVDEVKNKLFSIIAHDLRSPFHALQGTISLMRGQHLTPAETDQLLGGLETNLHYTNSTLDNVLYWAKSQMQGDFVQPKSILLHPAVAFNLGLVADLAQHKNISLFNYTGETLEVYADPNHLDLILRNLLGNAIKFTPEGGKVTASALKNDTQVEISIADTGIGMDAESREKIFKTEQHYSIQGTKGEKGTGLGLLLCKGFVEKNGGTFRLESEPGKGSTFIFTLPQAQNPA
jgi:two-component system, sensor histidine kinase and response regulator